MKEIFYLCVLKLNNSNFTLTVRTSKLNQAKTHFLSHLVGSNPTREDIFFLKSDIKWAFSYILIHFIIDKPQWSGQPQKSKNYTKK